MIAPLRSIKLLCILVLSFLTITQAEELCPDSRSRDYQDWHSDCFDKSKTQWQVKKKHLRKLHFSKNDFVTIKISDILRYVAVNRKGLVVIPEIHWWGVRDYPNSPSGISRFYAPEITSKSDSTFIFKCGYFKVSNFSIIVPAIYEHCTAFSEGQGITCNNCTRYCASYHCDISGLYGSDSSSAFNESGKLIEKKPLPRIGDACEEGRQPTIEEIDGVPILTCPKPPRANDKPDIQDISKNDDSDMQDMIEGIYFVSPKGMYDGGR